MAFSSLLIAAAYSSITRAYTWPNPQLDALESLRYDQSGYNTKGIISAGLTPCSRSFTPIDIPGRSNAADWIRNAYHDMATYNIADGTGGLDASIRFEQNRPENVGESFQNSVSFLMGHCNRYVSVADAFALGAVAAVEQCGGPRIAYRGGRVDATGPGPVGVPEPHQSLDEHVASFARQGFTLEEMIGLVACGHAFGGVERQFFPQVVPSSSHETDENVDATFDTTPFHFDNNVATEYITGTTKNPLVAGHNTTTNSDFRVFSSDHNKTMKAFAKSPKLFAKTCADLFARMVDTVPKGVKLTEIIEPLPVKPQKAHIVVQNDGTFALRGEVRFWNIPENSKRVVTMFWADRLGKKSDAYQATLGHTSEQNSTSSTGNGEKHTALWYSFNRNETSFPLVDPTRGLSKVWFTVMEQGSTKTYNQGGTGFPIQDTLLLTDTVCTDFLSEGQLVQRNIAIRSTALPDRVFLENDLTDGFTNPRLEIIDVKLSNATSIGGGAYTMYSTTAIVSFAVDSSNLVAVIGGKTYRTPWGPFFEQLGRKRCSEQ